MMKWGKALGRLINLVFLLLVATQASAACPPNPLTKASLERLGRANWQVGDSASRNRLAVQMVECLQSPDPELRDDLAFSALQAWMRSGALSTPTLLGLDKELQAELREPDSRGYRRPFAALTLAEVARVDRKAPFLSPGERRDLVAAATNYLTGVRDYRGFDDREGWRHGVAHGSDLVVQLALNPALGEEELLKLRDAVSSQLAPPSHFYIFGEPGRLATAIACIAERNVIPKDAWTSWIAAISSPSPLASWNDAYRHTRDLSRLHNLRAFLQSLYVTVRLDGAPNDDVLAEPLEKALAQTG